MNDLYSYEEYIQWVEEEHQRQCWATREAADILMGRKPGPILEVAPDVEGDDDIPVFVDLTFLRDESS